MRTIEKNMINAVNGGGNFKQSNTEVLQKYGVTYVYLFGNLIARYEGGKRYFCLCGYNTVATRSRLNALGVGVCSKNWEPKFNGKKIDLFKWYEF